MGDAGIFGPEERVELIDGEIVVMPPIGEPHADEVNELNWTLPAALGRRAKASVQNPIVLGEGWEPQPDFCLIPPDLRRKPRPEDIFLVVEVSDTTLAYDRDVKMPAYARAGIPEAWIVDLNGRRILVFREPSEQGYKSVRIPGPEDKISLLAFPDVQLAVADLLPSH